MARRKWPWAALAALLALLIPAAALADYTTDDGYTVHWAGGDNIVVTDKNGNTVYKGEGNRNGDRLLWDGTSNTGSSGSSGGESGGSRRLRDSVTMDELANKPATVIGLPGASGSGGSGSWLGSTSSPYAGTVYSNFQPIQVTVGGRTLDGYAAVFRDPNTGLGYSAIQAASDIGQVLAAAGFQVRDGLVLIHNGAPGATVSWSGASNQTAGASFYNVSTTTGNAVAGGFITITVPSRSGGGGGGGSTGSGTVTVRVPVAPDTPPPDVRWLKGYPEWEITQAGRGVPLVAEVSGEADQVVATAAWGGSTVLTKGTDGKFHGWLAIPANVRGVLPITFKASISLPPWYPAEEFTSEAMLTVRETADMQLPPAPSSPDIPDWWTPPWYQR